MKSKLIAQFSQPSTWRGLVLLASSLGVAVKPEIAESIIAVGMAVAGLIGVLTSDTAPPTDGQ